MPAPTCARFAHGKAHTGFERDRVAKLEFYFGALPGAEHPLCQQ